MIGIWAPGAGIEFPLAEALQVTGVIGMVGHHPTLSIPFNSLFPHQTLACDKLINGGRYRKVYKIIKGVYLVTGF